MADWPARCGINCAGGLGGQSLSIAAAFARNGIANGGLQDALLHLSKWLGLFHVARFLTRRGVRILCYHGFSRGEELRFRPSLFIALDTFQQRLMTLAKNGYLVVTLDQALEALDRGNVKSGMVVITVDDVFHNFATEASAILQRHAFPATAYVTTYYSVKGAPVFRLVVRFMFWKSSRAIVDLSALGSDLSGNVDLRSRAGRAAAEAAVIAAGESLPTEEARIDLATRAALALDVDIDAIRRARTFHIVTPEQIVSLLHRGIDIQLHTHRHRLPDDPAGVQREIEDNRQVLQPLVGRSLTHLCYPSGVWSRRQWSALESAGIRSATTCDPGLNFSTTPRLGLKRILDAEDVTPIRFEAEVAGFKHLLRVALGRIRGSGEGRRNRNDA